MGCVHAGRRPPDPHAVQALEIEPRREERPLGEDVAAAPEEEPSGPVTFLEDAEGRLDQDLAAGRYRSLAELVAMRALCRCNRGSYSLTRMLRPRPEVVHLPNAGQARHAAAGA